jgi:hypothetical protein
MVGFVCFLFFFTSARRPCVCVFCLFCFFTSFSLFVVIALPFAAIVCVLLLFFVLFFESVPIMQYRLQALNEEVSLPNFFTIDTKISSITVNLTFPRCFACRVGSFFCLVFFSFSYCVCACSLSLSLSLSLSVHMLFLCLCCAYCCLFVFRDRFIQIRCFRSSKILRISS